MGLSVLQAGAGPRKVPEIHENNAESAAKSAERHLFQFFLQIRLVLSLIPDLKI